MVTNALISSPTCVKNSAPRTPGSAAEAAADKHLELQRARRVFWSCGMKTRSCTHPYCFTFALAQHHSLP